MSCAMETHADFCYKLSAEDQEARAKNLYDHVEDYERQKKLDEIDDPKKDRSRSKTPKKEENIGTRKRTTTKQSPAQHKKSETKKSENIKQKEFTNKPVMKKYPLRSNKEVEDAEKLLAKYKTTNKKPTKAKGKEDTSTDVSGTVDDLDDTKNDSNYHPDTSTSGSSEQLRDNNIPLPTIRRPKTRSMKTEISASKTTEESGDHSSDAFEIIKGKHKTAGITQEETENDNKKKSRTISKDVPKPSQIINQKGKRAVNKSQISVKKEAARSI